MYFLSGHSKHCAMQSPLTSSPPQRFFSLSWTKFLRLFHGLWMLYRSLFFMPSEITLRTIECWAVFGIWNTRVMKEIVVWMAPICNYCSFINGNVFIITDHRNWEIFRAWRIQSKVIIFSWVGFFHFIYLILAIDFANSNTSLCASYVN